MQSIMIFRIVCSYCALACILRYFNKQTNSFNLKEPVEETQCAWWYRKIFFFGGGIHNVQRLSRMWHNRIYTSDGNGRTSFGPWVNFALEKSWEWIPFLYSKLQYSLAPGGWDDENVFKSWFNWFNWWVRKSTSGVPRIGKHGKKMWFENQCFRKRVVDGIDVG